MTHSTVDWYIHFNANGFTDEIISDRAHGLRQRGFFLAASEMERVWKQWDRTVR